MLNIGNGKRGWYLIIGILLLVVLGLLIFYWGSLSGRGGGQETRIAPEQSENPCQIEGAIAEPVQQVGYLVDESPLRRGPDVNAPEIRRLLRNEEVTVLARNQARTWWCVRSTDEVSGWVTALLIDLSQAPPTDAPTVENGIISNPPKPTWTPNPNGEYFSAVVLFPDTLLLAEARGDAAVIGSLNQGEIVEVVGSESGPGVEAGENIQYLLVRTADGLTGWVQADQVELLSTPTPPPLPTTTSSTTPTGTPTPTPASSATRASISTQTPTPTPTMLLPSIRSGPFRATPGPLSILVMISWEVDPTDKTHAIGRVRLKPVGGRAPFRYYRDDILQSGPTFSYRWKVCAGNPVSFRIDSADGQTARENRFERPPCPP